MAGMEHVSVIINDRELGGIEVTLRQLVANTQRHDLKPLEKARAIDQLMRESRWSAGQVAVKLGMSPATVSRLLALLALPESVREQVESGALAASTAYQIARAGDADSQNQLAIEASDGQLTRDGVVQRIKAGRKKKSTRVRKSQARSRNRMVLPLCGKHSITIHGKDLSLPNLMDGLQQVVKQLQVFASQNMDVADAIKALNASKP